MTHKFTLTIEVEYEDFDQDVRDNLQAAIDDFINSGDKTGNGLADTGAEGCYSWTSTL